MRAKRLALGLAVLAVLTNGADAFAAKKTPAQKQADSTVLAGTGALQSIDPKDLDPVTAFLLWQTSHKPELMNVEYLSYFLGAPAQQTSQQGIRSHAYYWYDQMRQPRCELYQEHDKPGEVVESVFVMHLPLSEFDFESMEDAGPPVKSFYDHDGHPTQMYSFVPATTLSLATPANAFSITKATVTYMGAPLPKPSADDMNLAHDNYMAKSRLEAKASKTNWQNALVVARERVQLHPTDAEAHIALAQALKKTGNIHDAISEYKYALSLNKYNQNVQQECLEGLRELRVIPRDDKNQSSTGIAGSRNLQFSHSGGKAVASKSAKNQY